VLRARPFSKSRIISNIRSDGRAAKAGAKIHYHSDSNISTLQQASIPDEGPSTSGSSSPALSSTTTDAASGGVPSSVPNSEPIGRRTFRRARTNLSNNAAIAKVFDVFQLASDETEIDHPLCAECTERLVEELESELQEAETENEVYAKYIEQLSREEGGTALSAQQVQQEIAAVR
jgi:beclin 1